MPATKPLGGDCAGWPVTGSAVCIQGKYSAQLGLWGKNVPPLSMSSMVSGLAGEVAASRPAAPARAVAVGSFDSVESATAYAGGSMMRNASLRSQNSTASESTVRAPVPVMPGIATRLMTLTLSSDELAWKTGAKSSGLITVHCALTAVA